MDWRSTVHPQHLENVKAAYQRMLGEARAELECLGVRKDGSVFWKQIVMVKAHDQHGQWTGHHCFMKDINERKRAEKHLRNLAARLQVLSRRVVEVQEAERRHLARELHDEIGQVLSAISVNLHTVKSVCDAAAFPRIEESIRIVDQAIRKSAPCRLICGPRCSMISACLPRCGGWSIARRSERGWSRTL